MSDSADAATHGYYDWQVSTLMLARDVAEPLSRDDHAALADRQRRCEQEVRDLSMAVIPESYKADPQEEFPPAVVIEMTKATLRRAAEIASVGPS